MCWKHFKSKPCIDVKNKLYLIYKKFSYKKFVHCFSICVVSLSRTQNWRCWGIAHWYTFKRLDACQAARLFILFTSLDILNFDYKCTGIPFDLDITWIILFLLLPLFNCLSTFQYCRRFFYYTIIVPLLLLFR